MFGALEILLILGVLFGVTFGGGVLVLAARAWGRSRPDPTDPEEPAT